MREEFPEAFLSVSSEVLPQYREYERFSTVALNAFVGPKVASYVRRLEQQLRERGVRTGLHLMTSASGVATASGAIERPVNLLMSGPVAGVVGGIWVGRQAGFENVITLDVGGTSADIGLAQYGTLRMKHLLDTRVGPYQAMIPMVDVDTIGAGGGSIAYVDGGGIFRFGPRSAGAVPGPAAYGRGGTEPTLTDAMVNLGWLRPGRLPRRRHEPRRRSRAHGVRAGVAEQLGMSVEEASMGAIRISSARWSSRSRRTRCARASTRATSRSSPRAAPGRRSRRRSRSRSARRPSSCRRFPASPRRSGCSRPTWSTSTWRRPTSGCRRSTRPALQARFEELEEQARQQLDGGRHPRGPLGDPAHRRLPLPRPGLRAADPLPSGAIDEAWKARVVSDFHDIHEREYSRRFEDSDVEIPNIRVRGIGLMPALVVPEIERAADVAAGALRQERPAWFGVDGELRELPTRFYDRAALLAGNRIEGPAIINQYDSTTVVPPGLVSEIDRFGNIVIWIDDSARPA